MPRYYVALDLETTGLDPFEDAIIEVGAVRFSDDGVVKRFTSLVDPGREVPAKVQQLTGINADELRTAPPLWQVLKQLARFAGNDPLVGHSVGFDAAFLARHNTLTTNRLIDTFELATILLPHAARHSLQNLITELDLDSGSAHRALPDAEASMRLFLSLKEVAHSLSVEQLQQVVSIGRRSDWEQAAFFEDLLREQLSKPLRSSIGQQLIAKGVLGDSSGFLLSSENVGDASLKPRDPHVKINVTELRAMLEPAGTVADYIEAYEHRPEQIAMLEAVVRAFNEDRHLLVEAGTGVGKSAAYLLPAMQFAAVNRERVVISTNTINLQEQLYHKDIPQLGKALAVEPGVALLKGRGNYLCLVRFRNYMGRPSFASDQALALAKIALWLPNTTTGDRTELPLHTPADRYIWSQVCSDISWCRGEHCREKQRGTCFFHHARAQAERSEIVIVNHALLTTDANLGGNTIPEYNYLIVDEGHQLADACTRAMQSEIAIPVFQDILTSFSGNQGGPGALISLLAAVNRLGDAGASLRRDIETVLELIREAQPILDSCSFALRLAASNSGPKKWQNTQQVTQTRLTEKERSSAEWQELSVSWQSVEHKLSQIVRLVERLAEKADSFGQLKQDTDTLQFLTSVAKQLQENTEMATEIISSPATDYVYWLSSRDAGETVYLNRAPLAVADALAEFLFEDKKAVILTSATLTTDGNFSYLAEQIGLDEYDKLAVGSPFNYRRNALVCIALDVPEPRNPGHQKTVEQAILDLARATEGGLMALFTSYSQLRTTSRALAQPLESEGIVLYSQLESSSRHQLLEGFKNAKRSVLLGTRSFWEGVDVPGEALQCLVMVKLPFMVPDDPLVAARSEEYDDSFSQYLLPEAILTFRQGFGRLIRRKSDRGVFVILDSRVRTKNYGSRFLRALPNCTFYEGPVKSLASKASLWLQFEDNQSQ